MAGGNGAAPPVVIVGAGQAGLQAAVEIRARGHEGAVILVGEEDALPYHRPPLSKAYLTGEKSAEALLMRGEAFFAEQGITLELGRRAESIDRVGRTLTLDDGRALSYGALVLAAGASARRLAVPGADLDGVLTLRSRADADLLRLRLERAERLVVVGGGFIGLEAAASARKLGREVTLIEALPRLMARAVGEGMSAFFAEAHRAHGVDLRLGAGLASIDGSAGRVAGVTLATGEQISCDLVLVGIGVAPNVALAESAGLVTRNGVVVDAHQRTSDPAIYALGDCAAFPNPVDGAMIRLESVQNAVDQAKIVADAILGGSASYAATPWFWSDQYDFKLQMVGLSAGHDQVVERGSRTEGRFSAFYFRAGSLIAIDSVNRPADHMRGRKLLAGPDPVGEADIDRLFPPTARG